MMFICCDEDSLLALTGCTNPKLCQPKTDDKVHTLGYTHEHENL